MKCSLKFLALGIGLILSAVHRIEADSSADYFVKELPGLPKDSGLITHAGHITIDSATNSNIFFWLINSRHISDVPKFVIWINGGPGCSSMDGLFLGNGPWRMNPDQTLRLIEGSWNEYSTVLYIDFPAGTGFSFADSNAYLNNTSQVSTQFLAFLDGFFGVFPEFSKDQIYLSGESYAGTFIPYIASAILNRNHERKTPENQKYDLKGIAIGNGWIDPVSQYNAYYTFSVEKGLLDGDDMNIAEEQLNKCMEEQRKKPTIHLDICEEVLQTVLNHSKKGAGDSETCINQYDIRDYSDSYPSCGSKWPYELSDIKQYLRRPDVIGAIHAEAQQLGWVECNLGVGRAFDGDTSPPSVTLLPDLLKKINVLLYSGDQDLICNINGAQDMINNLGWNGHKGFRNLTGLPYFVNNSKVGHVLSERNLTYVVVYNASHMATYDAPITTMDMMYRFMGLDHHIVDKWPSSIGSESGDDSGEFESTEGDEMWDKYYNVGTFTLVIVIIGIVGLVAFICRRRRNTRSTNQVLKAAVENESGEMEELVIETPLFQSDDVDHFGDSEPEDDDNDNSASSSNNNIRERNQGGRYYDDDDKEERMRLRPSDER